MTLTRHRHLRPGYGYVQLIEIDFEPRCDDGTLPPDAVLFQWYDYVVQATAMMRKPIAYRHSTKEELRRAGFVDITEQVIQVPLCSWNNDPLHNDLANYHRLAMTELRGLEALSLAAFTKAFQWSLDATFGLLAAVKQEINTKAFHKYNNV